MHRASVALLILPFVTGKYFFTEFTDLYPVICMTSLIVSSSLSGKSLLSCSIVFR